MENDFGIDLDNYEVVRKEYFNNQQEPQFTFNNGRAYINGFGLKSMDMCEYVQLLFDKEKKTLVVKPSNSKQKDALRWCTSGKKRKPRHMRCIPLFYLVYQMMGWNMNGRYRITGFKKESNGKDILFFDLSDAICYMPTGEYDENGRAITIEQFPKQWEGTFGLSTMDYETREDVEVYDEEMVFNVPLEMNKKKKKQVMEAEDSTETVNQTENSEV